MAGEGYGETAPYGDLAYKGEVGGPATIPDDKKHFQAMVNAFPVKELLEVDDG